MDREAFVKEFINDDVQSEKSIKSKSRKCYFPGCGEHAINSHTISKENALRSIARDGHVFCFYPKISEQVHILEPRKVGIGDTLTFYGFCKTHEKLFCNIDQGIFKTEYDLVLQMFRCIARWRFLESERNELIRKHQRTLWDQEEKIFEGIGISVNTSHIIEYDSGMCEVARMFTDLVDMINAEKQQLEKNDIDGKNVIKIGKWTILYEHLDYQIPIALSSRNPFGLGDNIYSIFWTVVPQKSTTDVMIMLDADGINAHIGLGTVEKEWKRRIQSPILLIEMVEAAMASTEYWYIAPIVYDNLSEEKKENLRFDVKYKCIYAQVWETIDYTIFEDLWKKLVALEHNSKIVSCAEEKMKVVPPMPSADDWEYAEKELGKKLFNIYHPW